MTLQEFIAKYNGQGIDFDGSYGVQCVDLMNQYLIDVCGISSPIQSFPGATAFEIYKNVNNSQFEKIDNTPTGVPQSGDIIFWNTSIGSAGHVAIFISGDANTFTSFDQNWPVGSACHEQSHDYNGVAGWLHPKTTTQGTYVDAATFTSLVHKSSMYDSFVQAGYENTDDIDKALSNKDQIIQGMNETITSKNQQIANLQNEISTLTSQVSGLETQRDMALEQAKQLPQTMQELTQAKHDLQLCQDAASTRNKQIGQLQNTSYTTATNSELFKELFTRLFHLK